MFFKILYFCCISFFLLVIVLFVPFLDICCFGSFSFLYCLSVSQHGNLLICHCFWCVCVFIWCLVLVLLCVFFSLVILLFCFFFFLDALFFGIYSLSFFVIKYIIGFGNTPFVTYKFCIVVFGDNNICCMFVHVYILLGCYCVAILLILSHLVAFCVGMLVQVRHYIYIGSMPFFVGIYYLQFPPYVFFLV